MGKFKRDLVWRGREVVGGTVEVEVEGPVGFAVVAFAASCSFSFFISLFTFNAMANSDLAGRSLNVAAAEEEMKLTSFFGLVRDLQKQLL